MINALNILEFINQAGARQEASALVTITDVIGSGSRSAGTQMAVSQSGAFAGSLSGGCVEAAIIGEARKIMASGLPQKLRYGLGSPFFDIRLPCGGGIDVLVTPIQRGAQIERACSLLARRHAVELRLDPDGSISVDEARQAQRPGWQGERFVLTHIPNLHLVIAGNGPETLTAAKLAGLFGADVTVLSPQEDILGAAEEAGLRTRKFRRGQPVPDLYFDRWSALALFFHDHDLEAELLAQALEQTPFFIGAMGSGATHIKRLEKLTARGLPASALGRVNGPIGLIPSARDPETLALSALAQIADCYHKISRPPSLQMERVFPQVMA